ncbi:MAG TPA: D-alanyl-D-alanine carboxypeptidase [Pseudolysinimonas sp.]|nr:D-alanyl-D-alanine carboxypeptidase [Pseudolysinimonas sp.]
MPTQRQVYRRRRVVVGILATALLGVSTYLPMTLLAPVGDLQPTLALHDEAPGDAATLAFPGYGATAVGAVGFPGTLATSGSTAALPMASITKVVTVLTVLEAHPLGVDEAGPSVTMSRSDVSYYPIALAQNGTVVPVHAGEVYTQRELLDLTLVKSANNYARSLAVWAFGSDEAYLTAARAWVAAHNLPSVVIADSTGLDPANVGTASDLIELGKLALANPTVAAIVGTTSITLHNVGTLENTNKLLGTIGVTGIKTGTLDSFGSNLLFSAVYPVGSRSVTVIGVMLGGSDHEVLDASITTLLGTVEAGFHELTVSEKGEKYGTFRTPWGQSAHAVTQKDATLLTWGDTPVSSTVTVRKVGLAQAGTRVGEVVYTAGAATVTVPLVLSASLSDPGAEWRLTHPGQLG